MPLTTQYKEKQTYPVIPADVYEGRLVDIEEKEGQYGPYWLWKGELTEPPYEGRLVWVRTNNNVHPSSTSKTSPRPVGAAFLGKPPKDNELISPEEYMDLIGRPARFVLIEVEGKDGNPTNGVSAVLSMKGGNGADAPSTPQKQIDFEPLKTERLERYKAMTDQLKKEPDVWEKFKAWYKGAYKVKFEELGDKDQAAVIAKMDSMADLDF